MIQGINQLSNLTNYRDEWAKYLNSFPWEWFVTLTFDKRISTTYAFKQFNKWKIMLKKAVGHKVYYFLVIEKGKFKGDNVHFHIFLNGVKGENPNKWKKKWNSMAGISDIKPYDNTQGASYYLSDKIIFKKEDTLWSKDIAEIKPIEVSVS